MSTITHTRASGRRSRPADRWRRTLVRTLFARLFRRVDGALCEPGALPERGLHRILVCRPNHRLGNMVLLAPLIQELEALFPGAEIDILGGEAAICLFRHRFRVYRVLAVPRRAVRHPLRTLRLLRQVRGVHYDLAIDACLGSQSGRLVLALTRARYKLGFPGRTSRPASAWHALAAPAHHAQRNVFLLHQACGGALRRPYPPMDLALRPDEIAEAGVALRELCGGPAEPGPVVGIFSNATGAKRMSETWWREFLLRFQQACPEVTIVDLVAAHGRSQLGDTFSAFYTRDLRNLAAVVANMQGVISGDCGVMHLAAATGTPTLGLFQTTDPAAYAPYGGASRGIDITRMDVAQAAALAERWFREAPGASGFPGGSGDRAPVPRSVTRTPAAAGSDDEVPGHSAQ